MIEEGPHDLAKVVGSIANYALEFSFITWTLRHLIQLSGALIVFQGKMLTQIGWTMLISFIYVCPFPHVNPIVSTICMSIGYHVVHIICYLKFLKVG